MSNNNGDRDSVRKLYFRILTWILICLLFVMLELLLRLFSVGTDLHLFVDHDSETIEKYLKVNPSVGEKYFTRFEATSGTNDLFLKQKPDNGFRVFLLGSSTLYGYPYGKNLMASRILHQRLQDAFPDLNVEVVNTSITAINSITLKDYMGQVLKHEPDAILIYAGHNEFYGAFGVGSNETLGSNSTLLRMHFKLINLRTYQLIRSAIFWISKQVAGDGQDLEEKGTLMKRIVGDESIEYSGEEYQQGIQQYRDNLDYMLNRAKKEKVPVFVSDLVSNVRDLPPFGDQREAGLEAHKSYEEALSLLERGDTLQAKDLFYGAKDLDPIRFRASEEINNIILELIEKHQANLIPTKDFFEFVSEGGLIGNQLLTEHVHPNIEGQFLLADAFFSSILASSVIKTAPDLQRAKSKEYYRQQWAYTPLDSLIGSYKIQYLKSHWPFTSLSSDLSFVDTFKTSGLVDSLAFSVLTNPRTSIASLHMVLADRYEKRGELNMALKEFEALIQINPYAPTPYNRAANCLLKLNDLYAAEIYLQKSLSYGRNLYAYSVLGDLETIKQNYKGAIEHYQAALNLSEKGNAQVDEEESFMLAAVENSLAELKAKISRPLDYQNFSYPKYIPYNIKAIYNKALIFTSTNLDSAMVYLQQCLTINDCPLVNFRIGDILYQRQDLNALSYYQKAYSGFAYYPDFLVRYCVTNVYAQNLVKARELFAELSEIAPQHPNIPNLKQAIGI